MAQVQVNRFDYKMRYVLKTFDKSSPTRYANHIPMQTYQNLTDPELVIPNVGIVPLRGTIESSLELDSPSLQTTTGILSAHYTAHQLQLTM
jgi:hypothetical protein